MKKPVIIEIAVVLAIAGCGKAQNPLLAASDGQFARFIEPRSALAPSCAAALYDPSAFVQQYNALKFSPEGRIAEVSEAQKSECVTDLKKRASEVGIAGEMTTDHLSAEKVRQRYLAAMKK